jgi:hypothetical protein
MEIKEKFTEATPAAIQKIANHAKPYVEDKEYKNFQYYSDNVYPEDLIDRQRPNEQKESKEYRALMYQPVFSEVFNKVFQSISKINRADGFFIKYPDMSGFSSVAEDEKLNHYMKDMHEWLFNICLKQYLIDANAVCLIWAYQNEDATKYNEPKPYIINTDLVMYFDDDLLVYKSKDEDYTFYSVDKNALIKWKRNNKSKFYADVTIPNGAKELTAFKLGGVLKGQDGIYESRIKAMLPWLNVATVEFSDLRAEITMHIHSQQWIYENESCGTCKGTGYLSGTNKGEKVKCTNAKCNSGYIARSPFEVIKVRGDIKTNMGETPAPIPPMGYIQKDVEIAKLQSARINEQTYSALSAINMQFLYQIPAVQSGVAKSYDMDETNNLFYSIATDLARIIKEVSEYTAVWRYGFLYPDEEKRNEMLPTVIIPNSFDIASAQMIVEEIKMAKDSGLNDAVLSEIEIEYIKKKFPNDIAMQNKMITAFNLDPASGKTDEEKGYLIANRMMSKADGIISTYIFDFISKAITENKDFYTLTKDEQMKIMYDYATKKEAEITLRDRVTKTV